MKEVNKIDEKGHVNMFGRVILLFMRRFFCTFGCITLAFALVGLILNEDYVMFCSQIMWNALFSALIALTFTICDFIALKMNVVAVRSIHFILSYASFFVTYVTGGAAKSYLTDNSAATNKVFMVICMTLLFIGVYAVVAFVRLGAGAFVRTRADKNKDYEKIYTGINTEADK